MLLGRTRVQLLILHSIAVWSAAVAVESSTHKFLIISAPRDSKISYVRLGRHGSRPGEVQTLIDSGLVHPQGLALDHQRKKLLVADPDANKIFSYDLIQTLDTLAVGPQTVCVSGNEARWVAVDWVGNIFFTDEPKNQILKVPSAQVARGNSTPQVIYDGTALNEVSAPGGIAADSFYAFWVNKHIGTQVGSVIRASSQPEGPAGAPAPLRLTRNVEKSYGVCLALNNVFFSQPDTTISGIKKAGGDAVVVSDRLTNPRGCAWDGEGTVYVADRGANAVYSFASNMQDLGLVQLSKAVDFQDAFGVAVFTGHARRLWGVSALGLAAAVQVVAMLVSSL